tara:strand:- start:245 stop:889 length:645 start_codon:yes stop_codon:yes gene_type:complete
MKIIDNLAQKLYLGVSNIPGAGVGLFTDTEVLNGTPVCEYKGEILESADDIRLTQKYNYTLGMGFDKPAALYSIRWSSANTQEKKLIDAHPSLTNEPTGLGSYANDILGWQERIKPEWAKEKKRREENEKTIAGIKENKKLDVKAGYNVAYWAHPTDVVIYLIAIRDINPGEEIYVNYGDDYWDPFLRVMAAKTTEEGSQELIDDHTNQIQQQP